MELVDASNYLKKNTIKKGLLSGVAKRKFSNLTFPMPNTVHIHKHNSSFTWTRTTEKPSFRIEEVYHEPTLNSVQFPWVWASLGSIWKGIWISGGGAESTLGDFKKIKLLKWHTMLKDPSALGWKHSISKTYFIHTEQFRRLLTFITIALVLKRSSRTLCNIKLWIKTRLGFGLNRGLSLETPNFKTH